MYLVISLVIYTPRTKTTLIIALMQKMLSFLIGQLPQKGTVEINKHLF